MTCNKNTYFDNTTDGKQVAAHIKMQQSGSKNRLSSYILSLYLLSLAFIYHFISLHPHCKKTAETGEPLKN